MQADDLDENFTDELLLDSCETEKRVLVEHSGVLSKWTNYIHGWQDRFVILKNGSLRYFKSASETEIGCRGAISLQHATLTAHPFDECRFDVAVADSLWYLRAANVDERNRWIEAIELHKQQLQADSAYGSEGNLKRHGSLLSVTSTTSVGAQSIGSCKHGRSLQEKLSELDTYREIVSRQIEVLQCYFDTCAQMTRGSRLSSRRTSEVAGMQKSPASTVTEEAGSLNEDFAAVLRQHGLHSTDFKGESHTFKATTAGILATLSHTIELMSQRDENWRRRLEKELERRRRLEDAYRTLRNQLNNVPPAAEGHSRRTTSVSILGSPDLEEGPHCALKDDEFFDAIDAQLEKRALEDDEQARWRRNHSGSGEILNFLECRSHPLYEELSRVVQQHCRDADERLWSADAVGGDWQLFAQDGDMRMYRKELEEDGRVLDPLKAVTKVRGVTAREMCMHFWDVRYRSDWEDTAEGPPCVLEKPAMDTLVIHQKYQRVWPSAQRDSIFWSHLRRFGDHGHDTPDLPKDDQWVVVNYSTAVDTYPPPSNGCVRVKLDVAMLCKTIVETSDSVSQPLNRNNITCCVQYTATVNPGGWVPAAALRTIYKREYPRFLKKFTNYVADDVRDKPIEF